MPTAKVTKNVSAATGGGNVLCSTLISIKTKAWLYSFGSIARVHPLFLFKYFFYTSKSDDITTFAFPLFFLENLEKRTRWSKCFLLAACFYSRKGHENPFTGEK